MWLALVAPTAFAQNTPATSVSVTPSTLTLLVDRYKSLSVVDMSGTPIKDAQWSISPNIAELSVENGEVTVRGLHQGRAILTATAEYGSATAVVSILSETKLPPATVEWSVDPTPGYESLMTVQSVPTESGIAVYSIEWSKSANAMVRALTKDGQQRWRTELDATASPAGLKIHLPPAGELDMNHQRISDHTQILIGSNDTFVAGNNSTDPSRYGLPADGKYILIRICGANSGGIYLLERGRFRDRIVKLDAADGKQNWVYQSAGRLGDSWTVNGNDDVGIAETLSNPPSSAFLMVEGQTGSTKFKIPFPVSSSTVTGVRCTDPTNNVLTNIRPSTSGSPFTNTDGNMYLQVEVHIESSEHQACKAKQYSFDEKLMLLRVTPEGETEWKTFQHIHADGDGGFAVQDRMFAGETIPDGFGGVLAAWTYVDAHTKSHDPIHAEARISRIGAVDQRDSILPMPFWTPGLNSAFDRNMVLGEDNILYATNGILLVRFDTQTGLADWVRHPPAGVIRLDHATAGGGVLVTNAGELTYFTAKGDGFRIPWSEKTEDLDDIGVIQTDVFDHTLEAPLILREINLFPSLGYLGVEEGASKGHGGLMFLSVQ
jgi:hypothetical protein